MKTQLFAGLLVLSSLSLAAWADRPTPEQREAFHQAMDACRTETGVAKPQKGQRPTDAERKAIGDCLAAKGFTPPPGFHGRHHHHHDAQGNPQAPADAE